MLPVGIGRRAGAKINRLSHRALAADKLVRGLAELALSKTHHLYRDAVDHHMRDPSRSASFGIEQQQRKALGPFRHAGSSEGWRKILADAIRAALLVIARVFCGQRAVVWDRWR